MRTRLLEHDRCPRLELHAAVHAAAVGEVQGALDAVGELVDGEGVARLEVGDEQLGEPGPGRWAEDRPALVGDERARRVLDRRDERAGLGRAGPGQEPAVAHVERAVAPAQVAEDVRPRLTREQRAELLEGAGELVVVDGVDRHELATGGPVGGLAVAQEHQLDGGEVLEGESLRHAVVADRGEDLGRVGHARRDVDLPSLGRQRHVVREVVAPVAVLGDVPPVRHGDVQPADVRRLDQRVVEDGVGDDVLLVPEVHAARTVGAPSSPAAGGRRCGSRTYGRHSAAPSCAAV